MKKLLCLFSASLLVLTSCSKDDDNSSTNPSTSILAKKMVYTDNGSTSTVQITYDGNKIVSVLDDGYKSNYTYTGDVITKIVALDLNNQVDNTIEYTYSNGKVAYFVESEPGATSKYKTAYTYNSDGTVSYKVIQINNTTNAETETSTGVFTLKDGNVVKIVRSSGGSSNTYTTTYEYDTKNSPFKNILGFNLLLDNEEVISVNNVVKNTEISTNSGGTSTTVYTSTYTYDANGFPTEQKSFKNGTPDGTTQYSY